MAIFEYKCNKCKAIKDKITTYNKRKNSHKCPECTTGTLEFQEKIHKSGFQLKGNGWYGSGRN